ncbi:DUF3122 domain-containing protein [Spirulina sp. CS-785/01]|uniref:DUF3122 domain-containing protein n=1 Tax=Spirulina sp. CS-785/01 TaxID=3021716 RepID=UPI00232FC82A|nr:DUF3122 domain-containing protein [Spirulina sp. CS-785/01]MDB9311806.1 DUF3122 domain-containing protein [Spirulina sp. CS-785/01]
MKKHWFALILSSLLLLSFWIAPPANAVIRITQEGFQKTLYRSQQTIKDQQGYAWQVVLFKRTQPDKPADMNLRLVGYPDVTQFLHPQPLKIVATEDQEFLVPDRFAEKTPASNVGQYDVTGIIKQLPAVNFLRLELPLKDPHELRIPYFVVKEWKNLAEKE